MSQPFSNPYIYRACYLHDSIPENARDATRKVGYKNRVFKRFDVRRGNVRSSRVDIILFGEKHATTMSRYIVCVFIVTILVREYSNFSANHNIHNELKTIDRH